MCVSRELRLEPSSPFTKSGPTDLGRCTCSFGEYFSFTLDAIAGAIDLAIASFYTEVKWTVLVRSCTREPFPSLCLSVPLLILPSSIFSSGYLLPSTFAFLKESLSSFLLWHLLLSVFGDHLFGDTFCFSLFFPLETLSLECAISERKEKGNNCIGIEISKSLAIS